MLGEVMEIPPEDVPEDASVENVPGWDSLRQLELMLALEIDFGLRIPAEAMLELQSVAAIEDFLVEHGRA